MNQEAVSRQLVVVVGPSAVHASLELLLRPTGLSVASWHEGLDPVWGSASPRAVVAHFPADVPEALARLAAIRAAFAGIPLVALSDEGDPALAVALHQAGVNPHFKFPAEVADLRGYLGELVGRASGFWSLSAANVGFALEEGGFVVRLLDVEAHLTKSEFSIMAYLVCHREQWITAQDLLRDVLGPNHATGTSLVRVHMHNIRRKLGERGRSIQVVRGRGYRLVLTNQELECETPVVMQADLQSA